MLTSTLYIYLVNTCNIKGPSRCEQVSTKGSFVHQHTVLCWWQVVGKRWSGGKETGFGCRKMWNGSKGTSPPKDRFFFFNTLFCVSSRWWNDDKFVERRRPIFIARYCCNEKKSRAPGKFYFTFDLLLLWCLTRNCSVYTPFSSWETPSDLLPFPGCPL